MRSLGPSPELFDYPYMRHCVQKDVRGLLDSARSGLLGFPIKMLRAKNGRGYIPSLAQLPTCAL